MSGTQACEQADGISALLAEHYPSVELINYVEANPPADEL